MGRGLRISFARWRKAPPAPAWTYDYGDRFLPLRRQLGVTSFGMNQIVLQPGQRGRIHRHERQEEVYLVLEGRLTLVIESEPTELAERS